MDVLRRGVFGVLFGGVVAMAGRRNLRRAASFRVLSPKVRGAGIRRLRILAGGAVVAALIVSGSGLASVGAFASQAQAASPGDGLPVVTGPVVKVGTGSPGAGKSWTDSPSWKAAPVRAAVVGTASVSAGTRFAAAGNLPVQVAGAEAGQAAIAPALKAAESKLTPAAQASALVSAKKAAAPAALSAPSVTALWKAYAAAAPGAVPGAHVAGARALSPASKTAAGVAGTDRPQVVASPQALSAVPGVPALTAAPEVGGTVAVTTLPEASVAKVGGRSIGFTLARAGAGSGPVGVRVDYSSIADAYGGDYGARLRLVSYPACSLTTPAVPACRVGTVLTGVNDPKTHTMTAMVTPTSADDTASGAAMSRPLAATESSSATAQSAANVVVATAGVSSSFGSYTATPLQLAGKWAVGTQSGDFSYSYPLPAVPAPAGGTPQLSLAYSSSTVDGMVAAENPQGSDIGAGWALDVPYIERQYAPCTDAALVGNTCWGIDAPTLTWSGHSGPLVFMGHVDGGNTDLFRMTDDEGWLVERIRDGNTVNPNGDSDGEYWLLTDPDGTQYAFGRENTALGANPTNSTMVEPIYAQQAGDTCWPQPNHECAKAWRWNLAYVIDADLNVTRYSWDKQAASYAISSTAAAQHYDMATELRQVDYGLTLANAATATAPARVYFNYAWRCTLTTCAGPWTDPQSAYPDVPFDLWCQEASSTCPTGPTSPVYFKLRRLDSVVAQKWSGSGTTYTNVDQTTLGQYYPDDSGNASATMFLGQIVRTGLNSGTVALPRVHFHETFLANRWDPNTASGQTVLERPRIGYLDNEFGGTTTVTYGQPNACDAQPLDHQDEQTSDCYPRQEPDGTTCWYRKWIVTKVDEADSYGAPTKTTSYEYDPGGMGVAWHSDNDPLVPAEQQGWSDYRGYRKVLVHVGTGSTRTTDEYRYLRGMDGDHMFDGSQRSVTLYTSDSPDTTTARAAYLDVPWLAGYLIEHRVLRSDGSELSSDQHDYSSYVVNDGAGGPYGIHANQVVQVGDSFTLTMLKAGSTERGLKHAYYRSFEHGWNRQIGEEDDGGSNLGDKSSCDYTHYAGWDSGWGTWVPDLDHWIIDAPRQQLSTSAPCPDDNTQVPATNLTGRTDLYYGSDWSSLTSVPSSDSATKTVRWASATTATRYSGFRYDAMGRLTGQIAPDNFVTTATTFATAGPATTTAYAQTNGLVTQTVDSDPAGNTTTTAIDPARAQPTSVTDMNGRATTVGYDPLGRITRIREPGDSYDSQTFAYTVSNTAPSVVRTDSFPASGAAAVSDWTFLDSVGRTYQSQSKSSTGAQVVAGTRYDDQGRPAAQVAAFASTGAVGTAVPNWYTPALAAQIPSTSISSYDDAGRETSTSLVAAGPSTTWTAGTSYDGNSTTSNAPSNSGASEPDLTPTTVTVDDYGNILSSTQAGTSSTYVYDLSGNLITEKTPKNATSTFGYDWLGNRTSTSDPDAGNSTNDYYPSGLPKHSKDAKNQDLFTSIDVLDRPTASYAGTSTAGTKLSQTIYDGTPLGGSTPLKGTVTSQTSYTAGNAYTNLFGYDQRYRTIRTDQVIPSVTGTPLTTLAGTYSTTGTFDGMDRPLTVTYPAIGGLGAETVTTGYSGDFATTLSGNLGGTTTPYVSSTTYTGRGEVAARILGTAGATGSVQRTNTFDAPTGRLTTQGAVTPSSGSTANVQNDSYKYTPSGQVTKNTDAIAGQQQCYTYDTRNRLTAAITSTTTGTPGTKSGNACTADTTGPSPYNEAYAYDDDGNLTSLTHGGTASTYGYGNNAPKSLTGGPHAPTTVTAGSNVSTYTYDADGQLTQKVIGTTASTFAWDAQQTLTSETDVTTGTGAGTKTNTFTNGPDGTRWVRQSPTETVVYLGGQELHLAAGSSTSTAVRYYAHDGGTIAERKTGTSAGVSWILGDGQGSAIIAVNATTGALSRDRYLPYGGSRTTPRFLPIDRGWLGQTQDKDTGLTYLNARYYDPTLAHFISTDPLNDQTTPQTANPYTYGADNPITFTDPSGLDPRPIHDPDYVKKGGVCGGNTGVECNPGGVRYTSPGSKGVNRPEGHPSTRGASKTPYHVIIDKPKTKSKPKSKAKPSIKAIKNPIGPVARALFPIPTALLKTTLAIQKPNNGGGYGPGGGGGGIEGLRVSPIGGSAGEKTILGEQSSYDRGLEQRAVTGGGQGKDSRGRYTSGENVDAARGRLTHKGYENSLGDDYDVEVTLPSGRRPDAVDWTHHVVRELKSDAPSSMAKGRRQLKDYVAELDELTRGKPWTGILDTYKTFK
jgi:RHS repeat-associated protein